MDDDIATLKAKVEQLEREHDLLIETLRRRPHGSDMGEFMRTLCELRGGRSWGWKKDYVEASQGTDHPVTTQQINAWHRKDRVPDWAFEQITTLTFRQKKSEG